jgi:hypothetical protein
VRPWVQYPVMKIKKKKGWMEGFELKLSICIYLLPLQSTHKIIVIKFIKAINPQ